MAATGLPVFDPGPLFSLLAGTISETLLVCQGDRIVYANANAAALTGFPPEAFPGMELRTLVHPDYRRRVIQRALARQRGEDPPRRYQFKIVTRGGQDRWVDYNGVLIEVAGRPAILATMNDITDDWRDDAVLLETEQKYADIFESSAEGIYQCGADGRLLAANPSFAAILGYASAAGLDLRAICVPEDVFEEAARHDELVHALAREGSVRGFDARMRRRDGRAIWVSINANALLDENLSLRSYSAFFHDVSEQRLLEERLVQAQKMEAIGRLAGGIAHDFNNILTVLMGYSESLLAALPEGHPGVHDTLEIKNATRRAAMLTQQLLAFGRKQVARPVVLDVHLVIRGMQGMLRRLIGENVALGMEGLREPAWVRADPHQVEQIVMNLVVNARDAMPGGGTVRVSSSRRLVAESVDAGPLVPKRGRYVEIEVADTGIGMSKETLSQIFEPFFTTKPQGQGTGLGLSTVYGIVEQTGGFITVESEPGRGSRFMICLPEAAEPLRQERVDGRAFVHRGGSERILVVEDDPVVRAVTVGICLSAGYQVSEAPDGEQGRALVSSQNGGIDLIITDVMMPRMGGREMADAVTAAYPGIRVLFMSGYMGSRGEEPVAVPRGRGFLPKPFTREELLRKIEESLCR